MLREIHSWWAQNLKDSATARSESFESAQSLQSDLQVSAASGLLESITFEVQGLAIDGAAEMLCPKARLHDDWKATGASQLFVCVCNQANASCPGPGRSKVENVTCKSGSINCIFSTHIKLLSVPNQCHLSAFPFDGPVTRNPGLCSRQWTRQQTS